MLYGKGISGEIALLQLSLPNPLKPGAKCRECRCSYYIWVINNDIPTKVHPILEIWQHHWIKYTKSTLIHARAWKEKALAGYNSQQIPTNNNIHKMLIIIISLRREHFVIISYLYKIPAINEPYNQRKRDIRQTHTDILTAQLHPPILSLKNCIMRTNL